MAQELKTLVIITCYHDPDYVRARTLRAACHADKRLRVIVIKNTHKGWRRYPEVLRELRNIKKQEDPDAYLLTFRGQELLPFVLAIIGKKPLIFDELVIPHAYATNEKHVRSLKTSTFHMLARLGQPLYKRWLSRCKVILADTNAHAELSAATSQQPITKYYALPVGTDETVFKPLNVKKAKPFQVFYYSTGMQPLHGIPVVLQAAELLKDRRDITFILSGGKQPMAAAAKAAKAKDARVTHHEWIPFNDLVPTINQASLCLGGPFGNTPQAHHVITGKTYQFLACGVPVLIGASQATNEYFTNQKDSLVIEQGNPQILADAIVWAVEHPEELKTIGLAGRRLYEKEFSAKALADRIKPVIDQLFS